MTSNHTLAQRSLASIWHPCTQMKDHAGPSPALPLLPIASAEGVWLTDTTGRRYLDAISSWWTNLFGHRHPLIVDGLQRQLQQLDHVIFAGFTHQPAVELAERLLQLAPAGLDRVFFVDNGSAAVEAALKMSAHYWRNSGKPDKTRFIALSNSYHGETLGALAVGDTGLYREAYAPLLMEPIVVPSPDCYDRPPGESWEDFTRRRFMPMEEALARHHDRVAAVIVEPLVQCAGGMRMYHPIYLKLLREACSRYGVHYIADEIATGFGRTGRMFANDWAGVTPDLMCLSKGITGGTLPLACVLSSDQLYQAFYDDYSAYKAFLHSHSYTGNPLACAAAVATLDIFAQRDWHAHNRGSGHLMWMAASELLNHPNVAEVRQQGMILAIELVKNRRTREPYPASERRGLRAYRHALSRAGDGVVLRPLGNVLYWMPPYVIEPEQIALMASASFEAIDAAVRD